jgi:hypothetical protein
MRVNPHYGDVCLVHIWSWIDPHVYAARVTTDFEFQKKINVQDFLRFSFTAIKQLFVTILCP